MTQEELLSIVGNFAIEGKAEEVCPLGNGLINTTYKVITADNGPVYVLQHVNTDIFPDPDMLMGNIVAVTDHIRAKLAANGVTDIKRRCLKFVPTIDGKYYTTHQGQCWRIMEYITDCVSRTGVSPESAYIVGSTFGEFQAMLADIPASLGETIKDFHNMEFRLKQLREVVSKNPVGRVSEPKVQVLLQEIDSRADDMCKAERMGREGTLPKRVCHCDTKVNNMMFNDRGEVLCVIDLDTVMPNFIFSDYGDFLRTGANFVAEDCADMQAVGFNMEIFKAFTEGYLQSARGFLLPVEIENLPYAAALFPYMQCVRFLWDYLSGDKYWKCQYPEHNFVRANNQFHLLLSVESHYDEMRAFIAGQLR